jgi:signal transduction histidine kinase
MPGRTWTAGRLAVLTLVLLALELSPYSRTQVSWFAFLMTGLAAIHALVAILIGRGLAPVLSSVPAWLLGDLLVVSALTGVAGPDSPFSVLVPVSSASQTVAKGWYWGGLATLALLGIFLVAAVGSAYPAPWAILPVTLATVASYGLAAAATAGRGKGRDMTRLIHGLTLAIRSTSDSEALWEAALEVALQIVPADAASGYIYDPEGQSLKLKFHLVSEGPDRWRAAAEAGSVALSSIPAGSRLVTVARLSDLPEAKDTSGLPGGTGLIALPLVGSGGARLGLMVLWGHRSGISVEQRRMLETLANQTAVALQNLRLREETARMEALKELDKLKTELLSTVSHEFRSPLGRIKANITTLLQDDVQWDGETRRQMLMAILPDVDQLSELVSNLLDMSAIEAGMLKLDRDWVSVADLIKRLARRWRSAGTHEIRLDLPSRLPPVFVDERRIAQVLNNLVDNAMKFSPQGSRVTVSARADEDWLEVSVADVGVGISQDDLPRLFDRFYRARNSSQGGTGLGLSICKGLVEAHGGHIVVQSRPNHGSRFSVRLPLGELARGEGR